MGRLRRRLRREGRPATPGAAEPRHLSTEPALSVVIPIYNVEPYLTECLESVRRQSFTDLEVLLVDDGSTDGSRAIMERFVHRDRRFVLLEQPNSGQAAARNLAVRRARGEFLTFVDGDDVVPGGAFAAMVKSLRATGSDLVVGAAMRLRNGRLSAPVWNASVHDRDRTKITVDDFPGVLWDVIACNRMFRRRFWIDRVGDFAPGLAYEDHVPMVKAYVRAAAFDLLARTTYHWRYRENLTSESQQKHRLDNLRDRLEVKREAAVLLEAEASAAVRAAWLGRVLDTDLASYIDFALIGDDGYRGVLRQAFQRYRALADAEAYSHVRVLQKIRGLLVAEGRWDDLVAVQTWFRETGGMPATEPGAAGGVYLRPVEGPLVRLPLPAGVRELAWHETALRACLASAVWVERGSLEVTGWAFPANVDLDRVVPRIELELVGRRTGEVVTVVVQAVALSEASRWSGQRRALVDTSAFKARIELADLARRKPDVWQLRVRVTARGIDRHGPVLNAVAGSSAAPGLLTAGRLDPGDLLGLARFDAAAGFVVETRRVVAELAAPGTDASDGVLTGTIVAGGTRPPPTEVVLVRQGDKRVIRADWRGDADGSARVFAVSTDALTDGRRSARWDLRRAPGASPASGVTWPRSRADERVDIAGSRLSWQRSARDSALLRLGGPRLAAADVEVTGADLVVTVAGARLSTDELATVELSSSSVRVPLRAVDDVCAGSWRWRFPLDIGRYGLDARPLPSGTYQVTYRDRYGESQQLPTDRELRTRLVVEWLAPHHRVRVSATSVALRITLSAPLADDELGRYAETVLYEDYRNQSTDRGGAEDAVLFQSWDGGVAGGDPLALHHALGHLRPGLTRYWAVADESVVVPAGAVPVVMGTREHLRVLARTRFLCGNVDLGPRLSKRSYQRFLQTFDGHPFSSAGRTYWMGRRGHPDAWIRAECTRLNQQWDVLLAPNTLAAELYRSEYDYVGTILTVGSPRCDDLVSGSPSRRSTVRRALGVADQRTVTLYAPTSRDLLTTRGSIKRRFDELDLVAVAERLGPRHDLWVRGHHDNKRVPDRVAGIAGIRDLTDYPDVNDLILAADILLTDYSAIRFDWAVTGKPMVFFVADEDSYFALRPALFEFVESAPGPIARTTSEVLDLLARPHDLSRRWAGQIAEFNRRFNHLQDGKSSTRVVEAFFN